MTHLNYQLIGIGSNKISVKMGIRVTFLKVGSLCASFLRSHVVLTMKSKQRLFSRNNNNTKIP